MTGYPPQSVKGRFADYPPGNGRSLMLVFRRERFGNREVAIRAMRNHRLTQLKMKLFAIELHRDNVRLDLLLVVSTAPRMVNITKLHTWSHIAIAPFL